MSATMDYKTKKKKKKEKYRWLKRSKMSLQSEIWSKIQMIQNLAFRILFLKYYFRHAAFLYSSAHSSGHIENYKNNILPQ